jgi:hypothetical protein
MTILTVAQAPKWRVLLLIEILEQENSDFCESYKSAKDLEENQEKTKISFFGSKYVFYMNSSRISAHFAKCC